MRVRAEPVELPREPAEALPVLRERLEALPGEEALLVRWRRDLRELLKDLPGWQAWPAVDGPSAWHFVLHRRGPAPRRWAPTAAVRQGWREVFRLFRQAVRQAREGDPAAPDTAREFAARTREELDREQGWLLPLYQERTGDARSPRELGYERDGIRRGLDRLPDLLREVLDGAAGRRELERFEIDVFHLVEHHVERLERSVLPLVEILD